MPETLQEPILKPRQLYENFPLEANTDTIRLLAFGDESGGSQSPLTATFRIVDLKSCPTYATLSYVWGEYSQPADAIYINGCKFEVTHNFHEALLTLSTRHRRLLIWVDAVCINQQDDRERASQIALMGEIYTWARPTFVWLGSATGGADKAVQILRYASALRVQPVGVPWSYHRGKRRVPWQDRLIFVFRMMKNFYSMQFGELFNPPVRCWQDCRCCIVA